MDASTPGARVPIADAVKPAKRAEPHEATVAPIGLAPKRQSYTSATGCKAVHLLDVDPDLGAGLKADEFDAARWACRGQVVNLPRGRWDFPELAGERDDLFGMIVVKGLVCREVSLGGRYLFELLGPGDLLQMPIVVDRPRLGGQIKITAVSRTTSVLLGRSFIQAACRWPSLLAALQRRLEIQREHLAIQGLITHLPRAEHRLLLQLWHMADRWGRMTAEGTLLPLRFTHELLGQLSASRRSTATLALKTLEQEGCIRRVRGGAWLLTAAAEQAVKTIATCSSDGVIGETIELRQSTIESRENTLALQAEAHKLATQSCPGPDRLRLHPQEIVTPADDSQIARHAVV